MKRHRPPATFVCDFDTPTVCGPQKQIAPRRAKMLVALIGGILGLLVLALLGGIFGGI
jgi:hypothetical protein